MYKKLICTGLFVLLATVISNAAILTDDFNTPHNYLTQGVAGTIWDGFFEPNPLVTQAVIDANITNTPSPLDANEGALYIGGQNTYYESWSGFPEPNMPCLYIDVIGDFNAIVKVVDFCGCWGSPRTLHNSGGMTVRVPDLAVAGPGEDAVTIEYFPTWDADTWRNIDDNIETENVIHPEADCNFADWYLRLRRVGNIFYASCGRPDPVTGTIVWLPSPEGSITRADMGTSPYLQLGMFQASYSANYGYISFDDFHFEGTIAPHPKAYAPVPLLYATEVLADVTLRWKPGDDTKAVGGHELYIDTNSAKVINRTATKHVLDDPAYSPPGGLALNTTCYWCVDEVKNSGPPAPGDLWSFTVTSSKARDPIPADGQANIPLDIPKLAWTKGVYAGEQDFFFGTDKATVENATVPYESGIDGNDVNTPGLPLIAGTNYFWRIDSNCGGFGIVKGNVWRFKTKYPFEICDNFEPDPPHDFLAYGVSGTIWDGIEGLDYVYSLNSNDQNEGRLYVETSGSEWDDNDKGFLLYKTMPGTFVATVEVFDFLGMPDGEGYLDGQPGLMTRISNVDAGGAGEDWVSVGVFAPQWGGGTRIRDTNNGDTTERPSQPGGFAAEKYFQIQRDGSALNILKSFDGITWTSYPGASPRIRPDFEGQALQIGIFHNIAGGPSWAVFDNFCIGRDPIYKAYGPSPSDGGGLDIMRATLSWAPGDFAVSHELYFGNSFSDVNNATPASPQYRGSVNVVGPDASGRYSYNAGSLETLAIGNSYYWRVDEVNAAHLDSPWKGDTWTFTIQDYTTIDSFERYSATGFPALAGTLRKTWIDGYWSKTAIIPKPMPPNPEYKITSSASFVQLNTDPCDGKPSRRQFNNANIALLGRKSMKFYYENDGFWQWYIWLYGGDPVREKYTAPKFSEVMAAIDNAARLNTTSHESLGLKRNWSSYKLLRIPFYGDPNNTIVATDKLYVGLWDGDNNPTTPVVIEHSDNTLLQKNWWQDWYIPLSSFPAANANFSLSNVARIYIGVGNRTTPATGGIGNLFIDEIQILARGVCIPGTVKGDLNDDCIVNEIDLNILTDLDNLVDVNVLVDANWAGQKTTLPTPIISLDASTLPLGPLTNPWPNTGTLLGKFFDANANDPNNPVVEMVEGKKAVTFNDTDLLILKNDAGTAIIPAPATITRDHSEPNDFTIIYEVWNYQVANEEWLFTWARRGDMEPPEPPSGTCGSVGYGSNGASGAVVHWASDLGFSVYVPPAHTWHTIGVTYDGKTEVVAVDGIIQNIAERDLAILPNELITLGTAYRVQLDPNGVPYDANNWLGDYGYPTFEDYDAPVRYNGSVASIKVYGIAIKPADLILQTGNKADLFADNKIDFKDYAVLASKWLVGPVLWP